jgi:hypothetical protein
MTTEIPKQFFLGRNEVPDIVNDSNTTKILKNAIFNNESDSNVTVVIKINGKQYTDSIELAGGEQRELSGENIIIPPNGTLSVNFSGLQTTMIETSRSASVQNNETTGLVWSAAQNKDLFIETKVASGVPYCYIHEIDSDGEIVQTLTRHSVITPSSGYSMNYQTFAYDEAADKIWLVANAWNIATKQEEFIIASIGLDAGYTQSSQTVLSTGIALDPFVIKRISAMKYSGANYLHVVYTGVSANDPAYHFAVDLSTPAIASGFTSTSQLFSKGSYFSKVSMSQVDGDEILVSYKTSDTVSNVILSKVTHASSTPVMQDNQYAAFGNYYSPLTTFVSHSGELNATMALTISPDDAVLKIRRLNTTNGDTGDIVEISPSNYGKIVRIDGFSSGIDEYIVLFVTTDGTNYPGEFIILDKDYSVIKRQTVTYGNYTSADSEYREIFKSYSDFCSFKGSFKSGAASVSQNVTFFNALDELNIKIDGLEITEVE